MTTPTISTLTAAAAPDTASTRRTLAPAGEAMPPPVVNGGWPLTAREARDEEVRQWDALLARCGPHRVMQRVAWLRSLEGAGLGRALFLVVEDAHGIVGFLPGLLTQVGPLRMFGSPLPGRQTASQGPVFDPRRTSTQALMAAVLDCLSRQFDVRYVELISGSLDANAMHGLGFRGEPVPTMRAPLTPDDPVRTFLQLKDSARRNIRRATRLGLAVHREACDDSFIADSYRLMGEVFRRGGHRLPFSQQRVHAFCRALAEDGALRAVSVRMPDGATRVAVGLFTLRPPELMLWQWAHRPALRFYRATELMTWTVMQEAMEAGCTTIDFMGLGDFKAKFGAAPDLSQWRWMWSRPGWLVPLRHAAERWFRREQRLTGRLQRWRAARGGAADAAEAADGS